LSTANRAPLFVCIPLQALNLHLDINLVVDAATDKVVSAEPVCVAYKPSFGADVVQESLSIRVVWIV
jgi:hypothetical protein